MVGTGGKGRYGVECERRGVGGGMARDWVDLAHLKMLGDHLDPLLLLRLVGCARQEGLAPLRVEDEAELFLGEALDGCDLCALPLDVLTRNRLRLGHIVRKSSSRRCAHGGQTGCMQWHGACGATERGLLYGQHVSATWQKYYVGVAIVGRAAAGTVESTVAP